MSCLKKLNFVVKILAFENFNDVGGEFFFAYKRDVGIYNFIHSALDFADQFISDIFGNAIIRINQSAIVTF